MPRTVTVTDTVNVVAAVPGLYSVTFTPDDVAENPAMYATPPETLIELTPNTCSIFASGPSGSEMLTVPVAPPPMLAEPLTDITTIFLPSPVTATRLTRNHLGYVVDT